MPVAFLFVQPDWKPVEPPPIADDPYRWQVTGSLLGVLRQLIADAVNEVDRTEFTPEQVVLHVVVGSGFSQNVPDWWFDIQPEAFDIDPVLQERRRAAIYEALARRILHLLTITARTNVPSFDIEIRPITGSGGSHYPGEAVVTWGAKLPAAHSD